MADIDQIIAGGAKTNADFGALADIPEAYWKGKDRRFVQEGRDLFKDGVPKNPDGTIDYGAMRNALFKHGDVGQGVTVDNLDLARQQLKFGQQQSLGIQSFEQGGQPAPQSSIVSPPSSNRSASTPVAPPLNRGGVQQQGNGSGSPQGDQPGSIVGLVSSAGIPDEQAGPVIIQLAKAAGVDPNAPVPPGVLPRIQGALQAFLQRNGGGQAAPQQPQGAPVPIPQPRPPEAPQPVAQPGSSAPIQPTPVPTQAITQGQPGPVTNALTTQNAPVEPSRAEKAIAFYSGIMSNPASAKQNVELAKVRLEALQKAQETTKEQKNYIQYKLEKGTKSFEEWMDREDKNKQEMAVLEKSIIPKLDKSQETASAARDDIIAVHRAREQLDSPGGIFSGSVADIRLKLSKVAEFLGVPNSDKIDNTETFGAAIGSRVLTLVKGLGSGAGISNADRNFAAAMAGGNITLEEKSIRRILEIGEQAARVKIDQHNGLTKRVLSTTEALRNYGPVYNVEAPGAYQRPTQAPNPAGQQKAPAANSTIAANPYEAEMRKRGLLK